jgi:antitoxin component YwqK of YwqJK toxin-antitoxin module
MEQFVALHMLKKIFFILLVSVGFSCTAQTYQVFKGDTINRRDKNNLPTGVWKKFYSNDTLFSECVFNRGKRVGICRTYYKNGKPQSILTYRGMTNTCDAEILYEDGNLKAKGKYIDKEKDSAWTYYDNFGKVTSTEFYLKGKKEGTWKVFYPNGVVSQETVYKGDKKNGPYKEFFQDGRKKTESNFKNDNYEGFTIVYHPNGNIWTKGSYKNGLREGTWNVFLENGAKDRDEFYKDGNLLNPLPVREEKLPEPQANPSQQEK